MSELASMSSDGKLSYPMGDLHLCYYDDDKYRPNKNGRKHKEQPRVVCIESTTVSKDGRVFYHLKPFFEFKTKPAEQPEVAP